MSRLIVISNRAPSPDSKKDAGGLVVALKDTLKTRGGLWIGIHPEPSHSPREELIFNQGDGYDIGTVEITPEDHENYYLGFSNSVLWPVFHNRVDLIDIQQSFIDAYEAVAKRLAYLIKQEIEPDDQLWVHDYHLIPLAHYLREAGVENTIGFFLHIPIPTVEAFMTIPGHQDIMRWFASFDLVGLQTKRDLANFSQLSERICGANLFGNNILAINGRKAYVDAFPISIDANEFQISARSSEIHLQKPVFKRIIGVDRLDYSKGLPQRFRAFGKFLAENPEWHSKAALLQIAPPTREDVEAYQDIRDELQSLSGKINGEFADIEWVPINYIHRNIPRNNLAGLFRLSAASLVTPLIDGMNLVAKEYIAAQNPIDPGVLILSRFAGAAEELKEAIIVNPHDVEDTAQAIKFALSMPQSERIDRHCKLMEVLQNNGIDVWAANYLSELAQISELKSIGFINSANHNPDANVA